MSKVDKLKLREIEELSNTSLMSYGSGSNSGSSSGFFCPDDQCSNKQDCGSGRYCGKEPCGTLNPFSYNKCQDMSPREAACEGLSHCQRCRYISDYGTTVDGQCSQIAGNSLRFCSYQCYG